MKKAILIGYYTAIVAMVVFIGMSINWYRHYKSPEMVSDVTEITVPIDSVIGPKPGQEYYYTLASTKVTRAATFPLTETKVLTTVRTPNKGHYLIRK